MSGRETQMKNRKKVYLHQKKETRLEALLGFFASALLHCDIRHRHRATYTT